MHLPDLMLLVGITASIATAYGIGWQRGWAHGYHERDQCESKDAIRRIDALKQDYLDATRMG